MELRKIAETANTITLEWDAVPGVHVYLAYDARSATQGGLPITRAGSKATSMKWAKGFEPYRIHAVSVDEGEYGEAGFGVNPYGFQAVLLDSGIYPAPAPVPSNNLGVYRGAANPAGVEQFAAWVPATVAYAEDFLAGNDWGIIESPDWWLQAWQGKGYQMTFGVPIIPDTGGSLAEGATGAYNGHFTKLGQKLVQYGRGDSILRLGWEFTGGWYRWAVQSPADAANFVAYWRHMVTSLRNVAPQLKFDWNPIWGWLGWDLTLAYPGDNYVDYIGLDVYDQSWIPNYTDPVARWNDFLNAPYGGKWHRDFAAAHGKPMSFPEWGLAIRDDGHGGGDAPYFIEQMHSWISQNNVGYHVYFEFDAPDGKHRLMTGQFPNGAAKFRQLFAA